MKSPRLGFVVLISLMAFWFLGFAAFAVFRLRPAVFEGYMGIVAFFYGINLIVFRSDAADLLGNWSLNRLMFRSAPQYRPEYLAVIGAFFAAFGLFIAWQGFRHI